MGKLYIVPRTGKFTHNIKGSSRILGYNRYYGLSPLMIVLTCTLKFGLKWSSVSRTSLQIFLNFMVFFVSLSHSFVDVNRKSLVGITLEFLLNSAKWDTRKNGLENGIATTSQKLSSFHSSKNCECFCCTPITVPTMCNNYCRHYVLYVGLFWFHLSLYKCYIMFLIAHCCNPRWSYIHVTCVI